MARNRGLGSNGTGKSVKNRRICTLSPYIEFGIIASQGYPMNYQDVVRDFAMRTRSNLEAIDRLAISQGDNVYEVTQLVNSLLGLLVFPQQKYVNDIPKTPLSELAALGWPIPRIRGSFKQVDDLNQLIRYLRNAVAHFNIKFVEDDRGQIAVLRLWNIAQLRDSEGKLVRVNGRIKEEKNWEIDLGLLELRAIVQRFIDVLLALK